MVNRWLLNYPCLYWFGRITLHSAQAIFVCGHLVALILLVAGQPKSNNQMFWTIWKWILCTALCRILIHERHRLGRWATIIPLWVLATALYALFLDQPSYNNGHINDISQFVYLLHSGTMLSLFAAIIWNIIYRDVSLIYLSFTVLFSVPLLWIRVQQEGGFMNLLMLGEVHHSLLDPSMRALIIVTISGVFGLIGHTLFLILVSEKGRTVL